MKKFKIINRKNQVIPIILKDKNSGIGSKQVNLMPKEHNLPLEITEDQISADVNIKALRNFITIKEIE